MPFQFYNVFYLFIHQIRALVDRAGQMRRNMGYLKEESIMVMAIDDGFRSKLAGEDLVQRRHAFMIRYIFFLKKISRSRLWVVMSNHDYKHHFYEYFFFASLLNNWQILSDYNTLQLSWLATIDFKTWTIYLTWWFAQSYYFSGFLTK